MTIDEANLARNCKRRLRSFLEEDLEVDEHSFI